ncbi:MAG: glycosyltransferase family 4 protein [Anaerolineales bacterium]|nr:glycosyltransferase family 4 protein [Anaerolineales bacterium]
MLKVLHLRTSAAFWGPDRQILQLIRPLQDRGITVDVLVLYRRPSEGSLINPLVVRAREHGARADQVLDSGRWSPGLIAEMTRHLRSGQYDLLHTHEYKGNLIGGWPAWRLGVPSVASVRGYTDRTLPLRIYKWLDLAVTLRLFTRIVAVSEAVRRQVLRAGHPARRVLTLHDAVDVTAFSPNGLQLGDRVREELGCTTDHLLVCAVGRLSPEKGHGFLLAAFREVIAAVPEARLVLVGKGPLRLRLQEQVEGWGLSDHVIFAGYRDDVEAIIAASGLLVMPSLREGFGDPLIEAMALRKPVIASRVGGMVEIVRNGETGLLVPSGDPGALAQAIINLLRDPQARERMGLQGRQVALREFSVERLANGLARLYNELASTRSPRGVP